MVLIKSFDQLVEEAKSLNRQQRRIIAARGRTEIPDGTGAIMLEQLNVDPKSANHLSRLTSSLCNNPPDEALCYLVCALCAVPKAALYGPKGVLLKAIRQGFQRAQIRTAEGWHDD